MLSDDHIFCCLFPKSCNTFDESVLFLTLSAIIHYFNYIIGIYIISITMYKVWIIQKQYTKVILNLFNEQLYVKLILKKKKKCNYYFFDYEANGTQLLLLAKNNIVNNTQHRSIYNFNFLLLVIFFVFF